MYTWKIGNSWVPVDTDVENVGISMKKIFFLMANMCHFKMCIDNSNIDVCSVNLTVQCMTLSNTKPLYPTTWTCILELIRLSRRCPRTLIIVIVLEAAAWRRGLHVWLVTRRSWVRVPSKTPVVSLSKKQYPYCLVLVGSRNGFERDFTIELNKVRALWKIDLMSNKSPR